MGLPILKCRTKSGLKPRFDALNFTGPRSPIGRGKRLTTSREAVAFYGWRCQ